MAVVPDPSEGPQGQGAQVHVPSGGGFGLHGNSAGDLLPRAVEQLGSALTHAGDLYGKTAALQASNDYLDQTNKVLYGDPNKPMMGANGLPVMGPDGKPLPDTGFYGKSGQAAMDARPGVMQQLDQIRERSRGSLYTLDSLNQFDEFSRRTAAYNEQRVGEHSTREAKVWANTTYDSTLEKALSQVTINPTDPEALNNAYAYGLTAARSKAALEGYAPGSEGEAKFLREAQEKVITTRAAALGALDTTYDKDNKPLTGPQAALQYLDEKKGILGPDWAPLHNQMEARAGTEIGDAAADRAWGKVRTTPAAPPSSSTPPSPEAKVTPVAATGPAPNAMHIGSSIATGTAEVQYGKDWQSNPNVTAHSGDNPSKVYGQLSAVVKKDPSGHAFANRNINLATGTENMQADGKWSQSEFDRGGRQTIQQQLALLRDNGADMSRVHLFGVGPKGGGDYANQQIQQLATQYGAKFNSVPASEYGPDGVHLTHAGYQKLLGSGGSAPAPSASAPTASNQRPVLPTIGGAVAPGGFDSALKRTFIEEGGYAAHDANGAPVNFGINQAAHPEVDVSKITREQAAQIYKHDYWDAIGGDDLAKANPALAHVAFDTAVVAGPARAKYMLAASGGDASKFMDLRDAYLQRLVEQDPQKYARFVNAWRQRDADLRTDIGAPAKYVASPLALPVRSGSGVLLGGNGYEPPPPAPSTVAENPLATPPPSATPPAKPGEEGPAAPVPANYTPGAEGAAPTPTSTTDQQPPVIFAPTDDRLTRALSEIDNDTTLNDKQKKAARNRIMALNKDEQASTTDSILKMERAEKLQKVIANKAADDYLQKMMSGDTVGMAAQIAHDKRFDGLPEMREKVYELLTKHSGKDDTVSYGKGFDDVYRRITLPPGDPDRISDPLDILRMGGASGALTLNGVHEAVRVLKESQKDVEGLGAAKIVSDHLALAKKRLSNEDLTGAVKIYDPEGESAFVNKFEPMFFAAYKDWTIKQGKETTDFPLFQKKKFDEFMEQIRPKREVDAQRISAGEGEIPTGSITIPPAPVGVNPGSWSSVVSQVPIQANGAPWSVGNWTKAINTLRSDPSPATIAKFNKFFGKAGYRAEEILGKLGVRVSEPDRENQGQVAAPPPSPTRNSHLRPWVTQQVEQSQDQSGLPINMGGP